MASRGENSTGCSLQFLSFNELTHPAILNKKKTLELI